jgi:hypothetical protein
VCYDCDVMAGVGMFSLFFVICDCFVVCNSDSKWSCFIGFDDDEMEAEMPPNS